MPRIADFCGNCRVRMSLDLRSLSARMIACIQRAPQKGQARDGPNAALPEGGFEFSAYPPETDIRLGAKSSIVARSRLRPTITSHTPPFLRRLL